MTPVSNWIPSLRANRWRLLVVAALIGLVGCSAGPPQDLRGPARQKGQAFRTEMKLVMTKGKLVMGAGIQREEGTCDMTMTVVEDDEILEVQGRQVTKQQTTVITDDRSMRVDGEKVPGPERGDLLVGEKILRERKDGKWKNTLVGKQPTTEQQKELHALGPLENTDDLYPEGKVKPGHTWKVDPAHLRKLLGPGCTEVSGEASMTFERTTTLDGEACALINLSMNIKGKMLDEDNTEANIELTVKGPEYRSIRSGYNIKSSLSGTMKLSGTIVEGGQRIQMEMSGPVTIETITKMK
jgi:hypothetical protein